MTDRTIWYVVADLIGPAGEPFAVLSVDTCARRDGGVEGTVVSLHWERDKAQQIADDFNQDAPANPQVIQPGSNCFDGAAAYDEYWRTRS